MLHQIRVQRTYKKSKSGIDVLYLNVRSLEASVHVNEHDSSKVCKAILLQEIVYSGGYDVVCTCETWFISTILDGELLLGYFILRLDREGKKGGGVLVAVKDNIRTMILNGVILKLSNFFELTVNEGGPVSTAHLVLRQKFLMN